MQHRLGCRRRVLRIDADIVTGKRGRPRSAEADASILDAAASLLADRGYERFTIEAVASRAGVAKTTVYRRWTSRAELAVATMGYLTSDLTVPDSGSLRSDLIELLRALIHRLGDKAWNAGVRAMQLAVAEKPELAEVAATGFLADRRHEVDAIIDRAIARGEVAPESDREIVFDLAIGAVFMRAVVMRQPMSEEHAEQVVDTVLQGYPNLRSAGVMHS